MKMQGLFSIVCFSSIISYNSYSYNAPLIEKNFESFGAKPLPYQTPLPKEDSSFVSKQPFLHKKRDKFVLSKREQEDSLYIEPDFYNHLGHNSRSDLSSLRHLRQYKRNR